MMNFDTTSPWGTWEVQGNAARILAMIDKLPVSNLSRKVAFLLRKPIKTSSQEVFDRNIWGLRMRLGTRGNLTEQRWLTMPSFHDTQERETLRSVLHSDAVFLDVGANAGFYTFWALSLRLPNLRVIAVEPTEVMTSRMRHNLAENGLTDLVDLYTCAVTPESCEVVIDEHAVNAGQTSVRASGSGRRVQGRPLLDILHESGVASVDAMKIDIEGFEVPVLEAFYSTAPRRLWPRCVIAETVGKDGECLKNLLVSRKYKLTHCTKMNGILVLQD